MKLIIKESSNNTFAKDKLYIEGVFSMLRAGMSYQIPFNRFSDDTWIKIVSDVRSIVEVDDENMTIEDFLLDEGYDNPEDELFEWVRDILDSIEEYEHSSRFEQYADTVSLLMRGEKFWW